mmetsp:Transcript_122252/g.212049  ORF Transcript_122252/g.212049 Transcript_122252/m.212049 type:complete len:99 (-) Transcript_122252:277-573(-)
MPARPSRARACPSRARALTKRLEAAESARCGGENKPGHDGVDMRTAHVQRASSVLEPFYPLSPMYYRLQMRHRQPVRLCLSCQARARTTAIYLRKPSH